MKILKRNIAVNKTNTIAEVQFLDCGNTIIFNVNRSGGKCNATIYHCTGFDEVGIFKYNPNGISVGELEAKNIKEGFIKLTENFFIKMQNPERYERTIKVLTEY